MKRLILASLVLLAGCIDFVDLTEAPPPSEGYAAQIALIAEREPGRGDSIRVIGAVLGGRSPRTVRFADDTLRVMGVPVARVGGADAGARHYHGNVPLMGTSARVRLPTVQGFELPQREFVLPLAALAGPDTLAADGTGGIELRTDPGPADLGLLLEGTTWDLSLLRGGSQISLTGHGPVPTRFPIGADLVPRDSASVGSARLVVRQSWRTPEGAAATVTFETSSEAVQRVRFAAGAR